jgi:hypothetical protein
MMPDANAGPRAPTFDSAEFRLHHIGYLVVDIDQYLSASHWTKQSGTVEDPLQNARLCLLRLKHPADPLLELIEFVQRDGLERKSPAQRPGLHHLCFSVPSTEAGEQWARASRFLPVTSWKPAVLFGGLPVRFYYSRNRELVELLAEPL